MRADLHFHSKFSDGALWPHELAKIAHNKGVKIVALTDHDTFEGVHDFIDATLECGIIGIVAIEINFIDTTFGFNSELLAYFPEGKYANTYNFLSYYQTLRRKVADKAIEKARDLYNAPNLDIDELIENKIDSKCLKHLHSKISLTRRDVFTYLNEKKVSHGFNNFQEFKNSFFNDPVFLAISQYPDFVKCIETIKKDRGYSVLAHPGYQFNKNVNDIRKSEIHYLEILKKAKQVGLWGIEMHSYDNTHESNILNKVFYEYANKSGLNVTFGSDFHSPHLNSWREIGCINGEFHGFE